MNRVQLVTRASIATLLLGICVGIVMGGLAVHTQADTEPPPPSPRTAYVDFLSLLKDDSKLRREQARIADMARSEMEEIESRYMPQFEALVQIRKNNAVNEARHIQAKAQLEALHLDVANKKAEIEYSAQSSLRRYAITAFKELRELATSIAKARGYTQVLNMVSDLDRVAESPEDFRALQQQLLLSPVLYFEPEHDLTVVIRAEAEKQRGLNVKLEVRKAVSLDAERKEGAELVRLAKDDSNPDRIDWEVKLEDTIRILAGVTVRDQAAEGDDAGLLFSRTTYLGGKVEEDGTYIAPAEAPKDTDVVEIRVASYLDPSVNQTLRIRLLNKDGSRISSK